MSGRLAGQVALAHAGPVYDRNLEQAAELIRQAAAENAQLVLTPEMTNILEPDRARLRAEDVPRDVLAHVRAASALRRHRERVDFGRAHVGMQHAHRLRSVDEELAEETVSECPGEAFAIRVNVADAPNISPSVG